MTNKRERGEQFETQAADYLQQQGLKLIARNYHSRHGEVDLIMQDHTTLVFVEVRYRRSSNYGGAALSITPGKQKKIALTALHYLQKHKQTEQPCRFDAIVISEHEASWIKSAFESPL